MSETSWPLEGTVLNKMADEFAAEHGAEPAPKKKARKPATVYFRNKFSLNGWFWGYWSPFMITHRSQRKQFNHLGRIHYTWDAVRQPWYAKQPKLLRGFILLSIFFIGLFWLLTQIFREIFFSPPKGSTLKRIQAFREKWDSVID